MSVALDLSRLRGAPRPDRAAGTTPTATPTMVAGTTRSDRRRWCCARSAAAASTLTRAGRARGQCPDDGVAAAAGARHAAGRRRQVPGRRGGRPRRHGRGVSRARPAARRATSRSRSCAPIWSSIPRRARASEREAQIVARLQHPAIVTVFDYGNLPNGAAFLVMEYVRRRGSAARC